jgi:hypothetical protein
MPLILAEDLEMQQVPAKFVPRLLTDDLQRANERKS